MELSRWSEIRRENLEGLDIPVSFYYNGGSCGEVYILMIGSDRLQFTCNFKGARKEAESPKTKRPRN